MQMSEIRKGEKGREGWRMDAADPSSVKSAEPHDMTAARTAQFIFAEKKAQ